MKHSTKLVCFALSQEAAPFQSRAVNHPHIRVLLTGVGPVNAERRLRPELDRLRPAVVVSCGFAGGLNPESAVGALVYETDGEANPGLARAFSETDARPGRFHSTARIASTAAEKRALWQASGADAVEMESQSIRRICREAGVPGATLRVISDSAQEDLPLDFNRYMTADHRLNYVRLIGAVLAAPGRVRDLLRLQRQCRHAAARLAATLIRVIERC